jgi:hypothetical protein
VRFTLAYAGILTAALFVFSNDQAHAVPDFRDGWIDQGGAWHPWPSSGTSGTAGQPSGGSSGTSGDINSGGDTPSGDSHAGSDGLTISDGSSGDVGGSENGNTGAPQTGGSSNTDLAGLNTIFNDPTLVDGPQGGSGDTQSGDAGGWNVDPGGSRHSVPEPSSVALLTAALVAAGAARRRKPGK